MNPGYVEPNPVPRTALHPYSFPFESVDPICEEGDGLHVTSPGRLCGFMTGQAPWEATRKGQKRQVSLLQSEAFSDHLDRDPECKTTGR